METEITLTGTAEALATAFSELGGGRTPSKRLISTYYDAEDGALWRKGCSLRLRPNGSGYELTLKSDTATAFSRGEWTAKLDEPAADPTRLPDEAPRTALADLAGKPLKARFRSDIQRTQKEVRIFGADVEVSLDRGHIEAGDAATSVNELELELLNGDDAAVIRFAQSLLDYHDLYLETRSKAARGMALLESTGPSVGKARRLSLSGNDSLDRSVAKILGNTGAQALANLAAAADGRDPEGVHQLRVALRRLRSGLALFKGQLDEPARAMDAKAGRALKQLGAARDLDVFLLETLPPVAAANPDSAGLARLESIARKQQAKAYGRVRALIAERRFNRFLLDVLLAGRTGGLTTTGADTKLGSLAPRLLQKRHKKLLKAGKTFETLSLEERHDVRIALKKVRYACDFFRSLYPAERTKPYLKCLSKLQNQLGYLNDAAVADRLVDGLAKSDPLAQAGAAAVKAWFLERLDDVEPTSNRIWRQFVEARPFWRD